MNATLIFSVKREAPRDLFNKFTTQKQRDGGTHDET